MKRWPLVVGLVCFARPAQRHFRKVLATADSGMTVNTSAGLFCSPRSRQGRRETVWVSPPARL
jgi:hypothetical protein